VKGYLISHGESLLYILNTVKPDTVKHPGIIAYDKLKVFPFTGFSYSSRFNFSHDCCRGVFFKITDRGDSRPVKVTPGKIVE
jgi:hypothetical protein